MTATPSKLSGLGRRKTAVARVRLTAQAQSKQVNGVLLEQYFPTVYLRTLAVRPLEVTSQAGTFGIEAKIAGGGKHAQAEALSLGIARALLASDPRFHKQLREAKLLTRDPRAKERKKPGLKRARRAPQFSKR